MLVVDLSQDFAISYTLRIWFQDLISYKGTFDIPSNPFMGEHTPDLLMRVPHYLPSS